MRPGTRVAVAVGWSERRSGLLWVAERVESLLRQTLSKSSCTWAERAGSAQGTLPSALPGSKVMFGTFSHKPDAPNGQPQRGKPASTGCGEPPGCKVARLWPAVMTPRHAAPRADDAVASHRAADGAGPSIEGARTYAHFISRGAGAASPAFRSAIPAHQQPSEAYSLLLSLEKKAKHIWDKEIKY